MGFSALDFDKIYDNGGKEFLETEYKEFKCTPKCTLSGQTFDLGIKVNLEIIYIHKSILNQVYQTIQIIIYIQLIQIMAYIK